MLVYRVEFGMSFVSGEWMRSIGPYQGYCADISTLEWLDENDKTVDVGFRFDEKRHPAPNEDLRLMRNLMNMTEDFTSVSFAVSSFHFGFGSIQKLSRWFDSDVRNYLDRCGYVCMVYEVDHVIPGSKQSCFKLSDATPVRMIFLRDIY